MLIFTRKPDSIKVKVWITLPHSCLKGVFQCKSMDRSVNYFLPWWSLKKGVFPTPFWHTMLSFQENTKSKKITTNTWFLVHTGWLDWKLSKVNSSASETMDFWPCVVKTKIGLRTGSFIWRIFILRKSWKKCKVSVKV